MLTREENELLTQMGPGTPMGELARRYWVPALQSGEIPEPDGEPVVVELLGERLVAFRDTSGRVGLLGEHCAHRGVSLAYARNEECGLRCIYHGWKYDVDGNCVDMPSEPAETNFKSKVRTRAYPVRETVGLIWTYMGPRDKMPSFPDHLWTKLPESHVLVQKVLQDCNYLQSVEGGIDGSHVSFLHRGLTDESSPWGVRSSDPTMQDPAPKLEVEFTNYGFRYGHVRKAEEGQQYIRMTPFIMPWHTIVPTEEGRDVLWHAWVPRDDHSNWAWDIWYSVDKPLDKEYHIKTRGLNVDESFRKLRNMSNKHLQDREAMKTTSFSGVYGIMNQDHAVQESMGSIYDRTQEHLGTSDKAVIAMRRLLLRAIKANVSGELPPGLDPAVPYDRIRSEAVMKPGDIPWKEACPLESGMAPQVAAGAR